MNQVDDNTLARRTTRATLATRIFIVVAVVVGAAVTSVLLYTTLAIRNTQKNSTAVLRAVHSLAEQITSCTNPSGKCAKRGQRQQGHVLGRIDLSDKANAASAATCAKNLPHPTTHLVLRCMERDPVLHRGRAPDGSR